MKGFRTKFKRLALLIGVLMIATFLGACNQSRNSFTRSDMTPLSHRLTPLFGKIKTVCFGRFAIDIPATASIVFGPTEAETQLEFYPREASNIAHRIAQEIKRVESDREFLTEDDIVRLPMFGKVIEGAAPGQKLIFGSKDQAGYSMYSFFPVGEHLFVQELDGGVLDEEGVEDAKKFFNAIATNLRLRANDEIPEEPGMCIDGGFIPLSFEYEKITLGVRLQEFPDVHFSVEAHKKQQYLQEFSDLETLLNRAEEVARKEGFGAEYARIKTFRRGPRELGVWKGFEILARKPPFKEDTDAHEFRFRSLGAVNDAYHPELDVQMDTGVKDNSKAAIKPSLTDDEAVALWDRLIRSIRVRTPADSKARSALGPRAALGTSTAGDGICPKTAWSQCVATGEVDGERRKHVAAGETFPYVIRLGEPTLWQKLKGEQPRYKTSAMWQLVEYDDAQASNGSDRA